MRPSRRSILKAGVALAAGLAVPGGARPALGAKPVVTVYKSPT
jgi:hypothetical protein